MLSPAWKVQSSMQRVPVESAKVPKPQVVQAGEPTRVEILLS
jgi:hypothetical protein